MSGMAKIPHHRADNLARGATIGLIGEGLILPVGLISAAFLTRNLGLERYGLLGVLFATVAPVAWVAASVLTGRAAIRLISSAAVPLEMAAAVIRLNLVIGLVGWGLFCAATPVLAGWLRRPEIMAPLMLAGSEILLLPLARAHRDTLTALGRYVRAGSAAAIHHLVRLTFVIALVLAGLDVMGVVVALTLARVAEILWCRTIAAPPLRVRQGISGERLGELVSTMFLYALCLQLFNRIDILLLTALGGSDAALSRFTAAQALAMVPGLFAMVVGQLIIARMTRSEASGIGGEARSIRVQTDQIAAVGAGLTLAVAGAAPSLSLILFGGDFAGTAPLLTLLLMGGAGSVLVSLSTAQLVASGRYRLPLLIGAPMLATALAGHLMTIPHWQALGAAAVTALVALTSGLAAVLSLPGPRRDRILRLLKALACGALGFGLARLTGAAGLPLADVVCGPAAALGTMCVSGVISMVDIRTLLGNLGPQGSRVDE